MTVFDIETDGLLDDMTKIHVLSYTYDGKDIWRCVTTMLCVSSLRNRKS